MLVLIWFKPFDTLIVFLKEFLKKVSRRQQQHAKSLSQYDYHKGPFSLASNNEIFIELIDLPIVVQVFIPMEFSIKLHIINSGLSIVYIEGSQVIISKNLYFSEDLFGLVCCFTTQSTLMVMLGRSVHLTLFPGQA